MGAEAILRTNPNPDGMKLMPKRKSKSGCRTCKIRRVKCDEAKPACSRCISTGRVCDGYGIWGGGGNAYGSKERAANMQAFSQKSQPVHLLVSTQKSRPLTPFPDINQQERTAVDFFRTRTLSKLPGIFTSDFWERLVLQACPQEPAVLHAVIALAATQRYGSRLGNRRGCHTVESNDPGTIVSEQETLALLNYNKAIMHLRHNLQCTNIHSMRTALISSMVFVSMELLRGRLRTGRAHLEGGLKILQQLQERVGAVENNTKKDIPVSTPAPALFVRCLPESVDDHLIEAFTRLNMMSTLPGDGSEYYLYKAGQAAHDSRYFHRIPDIFNSMAHARRHLDILINRVHLLSSQAERFIHHGFTQSYISPSTDTIFPPQFQLTQNHLQTALAAWLKTYTTSQPNFPPTVARITTGDKPDFLAHPLLLSYHTKATIMAATCLRGTDETIYDAYTPQFKSIIEYSIELWQRCSRVTAAAAATVPEYKSARSPSETSSPSSLSSPLSPFSPSSTFSTATAITSPPSTPEDPLSHSGPTIWGCSASCRSDSDNFVVDMGLIPPLYYLAIKCRVPEYRRYAIEFLRTAPHREGVWDGRIAAGIAQRVVELEEGKQPGFYGFRKGIDVDVLPMEDGLSLVEGGRRINCVEVELPEFLEGRVRFGCWWYGSGNGEVREERVELDVCWDCQD